MTDVVASGADKEDTMDRESQAIRERMEREGEDALGPPDGTEDYAQRLADFYYGWLKRNNIKVTFNGPRKVA